MRERTVRGIRLCLGSSCLVCLVPLLPYFCPKSLVLLLAFLPATVVPVRPSQGILSPPTISAALAASTSLFYIVIIVFVFISTDTFLIIAITSSITTITSIYGILRICSSSVLRVLRAVCESVKLAAVASEVPVKDLFVIPVQRVDGLVGLVQMAASVAVSVTVGSSSAVVARSRRLHLYDIGHVQILADGLVLERTEVEPLPEGRGGEDGQVEDDADHSEEDEEGTVHDAGHEFPLLHQVAPHVVLVGGGLLPGQDPVDGLQGGHCAPLVRVCGKESY